MKAVMWACFLLSIIAALAYFLMGVGALKAGSLIGGSMPVFYYIIPVAYVAIGVLVFLRQRWMLIIMAAIVAFTIVVFYTMYLNQPDVMWSAPGLITKIAQVPLLAGLIYLIFKTGPLKSR